MMVTSQRTRSLNHLTVNIPVQEENNAEQLLPTVKVNNDQTLLIVKRRIKMAKFLQNQL